jgi:hypothetical protein
MQVASLNRQFPGRWQKLQCAFESGQNGGMTWKRKGPKRSLAERHASQLTEREYAKTSTSRHQLELELVQRVEADVEMGKA